MGGGPGGKGQRGVRVWEGVLGEGPERGEGLGGIRRAREGVGGDPRGTGPRVDSSRTQADEKTPRRNTI